jgi:predicted CXXCH cytochrome family protein
VNRYWSDGVGHAPAVNGECNRCHDPHAPQDSPAGKRNISLCAQCHDTSESALSGSHRGIKPGPGSCLNCHDPHGGPDASLTLPVKHAPFSEGNCTPCHPGGL